MHKMLHIATISIRHSETSDEHYVVTLEIKSIACIVLLYPVSANWFPIAAVVVKAVNKDHNSSMT